MTFFSASELWTHTGLHAQAEAEIEGFICPLFIEYPVLLDVNDTQELDTA